jgi:S1-C subfamily serine protease
LGTVPIRLVVAHRRSKTFATPATCMAALSFIVPVFGQVALTTVQIAKSVSPTVVVIQGKTDSGDVLGSGFIVSKDGKIVTNLHVIRDMIAASVQMANGEIFDSVSVLAVDERRDLAVLQIAGFDLPVLELGNSDELTVGEPLVAVGSPRGLEGTVTAGILSSIRDSGDGFKVLQTDAAVNPGNSGGPLVNGRGQAIGVVSSKLRSAENLNFAVPINYVRGLLNALHGSVTLSQMRSTLSVPQPIRPEPSVPLKQATCALGDPSWKDGIEYLHAFCSSSQLEVDAISKPLPGLGRPIAYLVVVRNFSQGRVDFDPSIWHLTWSDKKNNQMYELSEDPDRYRFDSARALGRTTLFAGQSASGYVYFKRPSVKAVTLFVQIKPSNGEIVVTGFPVSSEPYRLVP